MGHLARDFPLGFKKFRKKKKGPSLHDRSKQEALFLGGPYESEIGAWSVPAAQLGHLTFGEQALVAIVAVQILLTETHMGDINGESKVSDQMNLEEDLAAK